MLDSAMSVLLFILGLAVALLAYLPIGWFVWWLRQQSELPPREPRKEAVPVFIIGTFERLLAFALVYLNVEGAYAILIAWMAAKLAASWPRQLLNRGSDELEVEADREIRAGIFIALMAGTLSLLFGVIGGLIARGS
jgi:uncharacterized protein YneF (UPF0154 family)